MTRHRTVVALDYGTDAVRLVVAEGDARGRLVVLGTGASANDAGGEREPLPRRDAAAAVLIAKQAAERNSGARIHSIFAGIPKAGTRPGSTYTEMSGAQRLAVGDRAARVGQAPRGSGGLRHRSYMRDSRAAAREEVARSSLVGQDEQRDLVLDQSVDPHKDLVALFRAAGLAIEGLMPSSLAAAESVLTPAERDAVTLVVDIGASGTDLALIGGDEPVWTSTVPIGGRSITTDLAMVLDLAIDRAEELKVRHGRAATIPGDVTQLVVIGRGGSRRAVDRHLVHDIINARIEQLLGVIAERVEASGVAARDVRGLVFTGGTALLPELVEMAAATFAVPARVGAPRNLAGRTGALSGPAFATVAGVARLGLAHDAKPSRQRPTENDAAARVVVPWPGALTGWLREILL